MLRLSIAFGAALLLASGQTVCGDDIQPQHRTATSDTASLIAASDIGSAPKAADEVRGIAIEQGTAIIRGHRLKSPLVISRTDNEVIINGEIVAASAGGKAIDSRRIMARIERELFHNRYVVTFGTNIVAVTDDEECMRLLGELARESSLHRKIELILSSTLEGVDHVTTAEWKTALEDFEPDESFVRQYLEYENEMALTNDLSCENSQDSLKVHDSTQTMYGLSVVGMLLIALSAGTLLGHPPKNSGSWSRIVRSPRTLSAVRRCLILIAAYSLFDLIATLLALRTGHVEEINPFGVGLILAPAALAAFKVSATCLGAGLLWTLKNYHGAQVASWWLCMILTLVTVRWVTVQSLFFV